MNVRYPLSGFRRALCEVRLWIAALPVLAVACTLSAQTSQQQPRMQVTFNKGLLTIEADDTTLGAILDGVRSQTEATIEFPASAKTERAAARLGPAPPAKVLAALLLGSRFDYMVFSSEQNPSRFYVRISEKGVYSDTSWPADPAAPEIANSVVGNSPLPTALPSPSLTVGRVPPFGNRTRGAAIGDVLPPMDNSDLPIPQPKQMRIPKEGPRIPPPPKSQ